jgi:hypothetical protein
LEGRTFGWKEENEKGKTQMIRSNTPQKNHNRAKQNFLKGMTHRLAWALLGWTLWQ